MSVHEPLQDIENFRLLRVRRELNKTISGELQNFCLASKSCPRFITFSYAWGASSFEKSIILNGHDFTVMDDVYSLLEIVCDGNGFEPESWLWIDSVCINQRDLAERCFQVSLMGKIYRQSRKTVVWLGESTAETDQGMDFLRHLAHMKGTLSLQYRRYAAARTTPPSLDIPGPWKALGAVLSRTWWHRIWTLQEFIVSPHIQFYCGTKTASRSLFMDAIYGLWLCNPREELIKKEPWDLAWTRRRLLQWYENGDNCDRMGILALIAYNSACGVTDPRDRIYGLLALARDADVAMVGQPTYTHSPGTIYTTLFLSFVETYKSLDIIYFAQLFGPLEDSSGSGLGLPSWVPDWSIRRNTYVIPLLVSQSGSSHVTNFRPIVGRAPTTRPSIYAAAGTELPQSTVSADLLRLTCRGVLVDYIDGLGGLQCQQGPWEDAVHLGLFQSEAPANAPDGKEEDQAERDRLADAVVRSLVLNRRDRDLSKPAPVGTFREDLQQLAVPTARREDILEFRRFDSWFDCNKALLIRGHTLKELCQPKKPQDRPHARGVNLGEEGFVRRLHDTTGSDRMSRRLCTTRNGHVGMAPLRARRQDAICVLFGCSVPLVLREQSGGHYQFVGECFLDGFMNGEILDRRSEDFVLQ